MLSGFDMVLILNMHRLQTVIETNHWRHLLICQLVQIWLQDLSLYDVKDGGWIDNREARYSYQNARGYTIDNTTAPYDVAKDDYNDSRKEGARIRISADFNDVKLDLSFLSQESFYNGSYETDV